jgi:predicted DNA-binding transcriptional regulator AlpA
MRDQRNELLPVSLPPLGLSRDQAAALVGIGTALFDKSVEVGTMPQPRLIARRLVWDVDELAAAFRRLPHRAGAFGSYHELDDVQPQGNAFDNAKKAQ